MPRRKPGTLLPLEREILDTALLLLSRGDACFHGFSMAQAMRPDSGWRPLVAHGTLYKALGRLEDLGLLTSRWEEEAPDSGRPRRRLYELSSAGAAAARTADPTARPAAAPGRVIAEPA